MKAIDVSTPDEYYPKFEYLCRSCSNQNSADTNSQPDGDVNE